MAEGVAQLSKLSSILPQVDSTPLEEDDQFDVYKMLKPVAAEWKVIGLALRLKRSTLDEIEKAHPNSPSHCLLDVLTDWLRRNYNTSKFGEPTWKKIVEVVADQAAGNNTTLAMEIAKQHSQVTASSVHSEQKVGSGADVVPQAKSIETKDRGTSEFLSSHLSKVKQELEVLQNIEHLDDEEEESKAKLMKRILHSFIKTSMQSGISPDQLKEELARLYSTDLLILPDVYTQAVRQVNEMHSTMPQIPEGTAEAPSSASTQLQPLFSKETLYHAYLCCQAVSTCTAAMFKDFFTKRNPCHSLEEVSLSRMPESEHKLRVERYLMARQGKTYYVAFQSKPKLSQWTEEYSSFEEGIQIQSQKIPLRFFVEQLRDGYRIVLTGFSFGGLLALAITASMWRETLSADLLKNNLVCITIGQPLLNLSIVKEVAEECPEFKSIVHSVIMEEDPIPRLMKFLNKKCEEYYAQLLGVEGTEPPTVASHLAPRMQQKFQGPFTSMLMHQLTHLQEEKATGEAPSTQTGTGIDASSALHSLKSLLKSVLPRLLMKSSKPSLHIGSTYIIARLESGLTWEEVTRSLKLSYLSTSSIDGLEVQSVFGKHNMEIYGQWIFRSFIDQLPKFKMPQAVGKEIPEVKMLKPSAQTVAFHRHGKEIAIVVEGDNLWFCHQIAVGTRKIDTPAQNVTRRAIQFNFTPQDKHIIPTDANKVKVNLLSHFYNPQPKPVPVTHKVYHFTFRQEQLAKLTPSELMEVAYLSALLEQHPHSQYQPLSNRFSVIQDFLKKVINVVPIESIFFAIGQLPDHKLALQCAHALMESGLEIPPSITAISGWHWLVVRCYESVSLPIFHPLAINEKMSLHLASLVQQGRKLKKVAREHQAGNLTPLQGSMEKNSFYALTEMKFTHFFSAASDHQSVLEQDSLPSLQQYIVDFHHKMKKADMHHTDAVCRISLARIYPVATESNKFVLKSPIKILSEGRRKLAWLAERAVRAEELTPSKAPDQQESTHSLSALYNAKMLEIVTGIRNNDVKLCTFLVSAFMEQQIRVPLIRSSELDTAKTLNLLPTTVAVGVWALFSLTLGDLQSVLSSIPAGSLLVEVKKYIRGIFKEDTHLADESYAGKLQFLVQGMEKTVSCNSHYISYSLERQLIELCKKLNISQSTPLEVLIEDWDTIFKDDLLSLVVPSHRSLIACWLKWTLMVHHLREELAKCTAVGVVGLVNSGKSVLVNTLFKVRIPVGTTEKKRTTVPFLYNLDEDIEGLDVVDFPGVDDRDETISGLADLLLAVSQIVVFVVDYRKAHTESAKKWLERLEEESVPVLVCLTYADKLYAEHMGQDGSHPSPELVKREIGQELGMVKEKLGHLPSRTVKYFSFSQDRDSILNSPDGRQRLRAAGICTPQDVGDWLVEVFRNRLDQAELADRLATFIQDNQDEEEPAH